MIKIKNAELKTVAGPTSRIPENGNVEFAFAGKSNVGKSSLINALMNRKSLARVSGEPGKTQTINYYYLHTELTHESDGTGLVTNNKEFYLVDLPGYGFAKVSKEVKDKWGILIERYLNSSPTLACVFLLVDIRHKPGKNDVMMYDWITSSKFRPIVIGTKLDKIKRSEVQKNIKLIRNELGMDKDDIFIPFSAKTKAGRDEILKIMETFLSEGEVLK